MSLTIQEKEMLKELEILGISVNTDNKNIELYNAICNKPVEILKQNEEMYIKIENPYINK